MIEMKLYHWIKIRDQLKAANEYESFRGNVRPSKFTPTVHIYFDDPKEETCFRLRWM